MGKTKFIELSFIAFPAFISSVHTGEAKAQMFYWCETDDHTSHQPERGNSMKHGFIMFMVGLFVLSVSSPLLAQGAGAGGVGVGGSGGRFHGSGQGYREEKEEERRERLEAARKESERQKIELEKRFPNELYGPEEPEDMEGAEEE